MATIAFTSETPSAALLMARVAAGGRVTDARKARERREARDAEAWRLQCVEAYERYGASLERAANGEVYVAWCFVCSRATDHVGEHDEAQMRAWRAPRSF